MRSLFALLILAVCQAQEFDGTDIHRIRCLQDESIFCIRTDRFRPHLILICTRRGLVSFNPSNMTNQTLAGYVQFKRAMPLYKYRDGPNEQALFDWIYDVQQLDDTTYIVSDFHNDCLRNISSDSTSTYAGVCRAEGRMRDGPASSAIFDGPSGLLYLERLGHLLVADKKNNAIRLIDTNTRQVRTIVQESGLKMPSYLSCLSDLCLGRIFVTIQHGVIGIDPSNWTVVTIAGGHTLRSQESSRSLPETTFEYPNGIVSLNNSVLLVINESPNSHVHQLDLVTNHSSYLINVGEINHPWSIGLHGDFLYIGGSDKGGLSIVKIFDCGSCEKCSGEKENSLPTSQPHPIIPTFRRSTLPVTTTRSTLPVTTTRSTLPVTTTRSTLPVTTTRSTLPVTTTRSTLPVTTTRSTLPVTTNRADNSESFINDQMYIIAGSAIGFSLIVVIAIIIGVKFTVKAKRRKALRFPPIHQLNEKSGKEKTKSTDADVEYDMYAPANQYEPELRIQTRVNRPDDTNPEHYDGTEYGYTVMRDLRPPNRPLPLTPLDSDLLIRMFPYIREYFEALKGAEPNDADKNRVRRKSGEESDVDMSDSISYMGPDMD